MGVITTAPHSVLGDEASTTVRAALVGRVPVIVSGENGPIKKGDRITSSSIAGIGMKASRAGSVVGRALEDFDPEKLGSCDATLKEELLAAGFEVPDSACVTRVMVMIKTGFDMSIGSLVQDAAANALGVLEAVQELANAAFEKGAQLTKFVAGQIVAKVAIVETFFAKSFTLLPDGKLALPGGDNQVTGWSTLTAGTTSIFVSNANVTSGSRIFITPRALMASPLAVTEIQDGVGFKVEVRNPEDVDVPFDWLMVTTYGGSNAPNAGGAVESPPEPPVEPPVDDLGEEPPVIEEPAPQELPDEEIPPESETPEVPPVEEPSLESSPADTGGTAEGGSPAEGGV